MVKQGAIDSVHKQHVLKLATPTQMYVCYAYTVCAITQIAPINLLTLCDIIIKALCNEQYTGILSSWVLLLPTSSVRNGNSLVSVFTR